MNKILENHRPDGIKFNAALQPSISSTFESSQKPSKDVLCCDGVYNSSWNGIYSS